MAYYEQLFNQKTIERLCEDITLTSKQKQASEEWLKLLDDSKLIDEKKNYFKFGEIILQDILGYKIKEIDFESDNVEFQFSDSKGKKILCFEAKGTSTKDLFASQHRTKKEHETPIKQTWDYMGKIGLDYGVCTNYKEFIIITKQFGYSRYHKFNFQSIQKNKQKLKEFVAIFSKERIIDTGFIEKLHDESITEEQEFTKEFYKLFHETRLMLIKAFQEKENVSKSEAIYFTQLFLNRLIFIFFVEDRGYVSDKQLFSNRILKILEFGDPTEHSRKIYDEITELFIAFDKGSHQLGVFGFNGGLFNGIMPQKIFFYDLKDPLFFSDVRQHSKLLKSTKLNEKASKIISRHKNNLNPIITNLLLMDSYDFNTEVNVNILGHIFEQSISDLEDLKKEGVSKRKKDGVYYTPEYITDYICRNTIIPYLSKSKTSSVYELVSEYVDDIDVLEKKFKELKIVDPACGSGAFLIKAIDILLEIHKEIQNVKESKGTYSTGSQFYLTKWNEETEIRMIIENNIYGVDINRESVEITQLSLFLKIASSERKLIGLSKNIKVGNSLVDDKGIDSRGFSWTDEFPEIMQIDKFDIVIGNPPYVRMEEFKEIKSHLKRYETHAERADLYVYFYEKGHSLLKEGGMFGVISSNTFMRTDYGENLRAFLQKKTEIQKLLDLGETQFFEDATTYPVILFYKKTDNPKKSHSIPLFKRRQIKGENFLQEISSNWQSISQKDLNPAMWVFEDKDSEKIMKKLEQDSVPLKQFCGEPLRGIVTGLNDAFIIDENTKNELLKSNTKCNEVIKPFFMGRDLERWYTPDSKRYLIFLYHKTPINKFPELIKHLEPFKEQLMKRAGKQQWWELQQPQERYIPLMESKKIIYVDIANKPTFSLDNDIHYFANSVYFLPTDDTFLLCLLNSDLCKWFIFFTSRGYRGGYVTFRNVYVERIPIKEPNSEQKEQLSNLSKEIIQLRQDFEKIKQNLFNRIQTNFSSKISKKLETFWLLNFDEFLREIEKNCSKKFTLNDQDEWQSYFNDNKTQILQLDNKISKLDEQVNKKVYELYGISDEEQKIIESSLLDM